MADEDITLNEAAEKLGVHYMTAYRYVRTGRLKAHKAGGVWSVPVAELADFAAPRPAAAPRRDSTPARLEARLIAADENGAFQILDDAMASGAGADEVYLDLLGSAMVGIGAKWAEGVLTIADEHVATSTALRVIARLGTKTASRGRTKGTILLASVVGDHHAVPTAILRDLLRARSFDVHDLGPNTPPDTIVARVKNTPDVIAVGIAATCIENESAITDMLTALDAELDVPVVLGGAAILSETHGKSLGPCMPSTSARRALELFAAIHTDASVQS